MDVKFEIPNSNKFNKAVQKAPSIILKNMRLAMLISCRDVQHEARAKHLFRTRTGALEMAIDTNVIEGGENGIEGHVFIDDAVAPYGKYVHPGTKPHIIRPKHKKALRWATVVFGKLGKKVYKGLRNGSYTNAEFTFAKVVHHPGTKKDEFIYEAGKNKRQQINDNFNRYTNRAIKEVGL